MNLLELANGKPLTNWFGAPDESHLFRIVVEDGDNLVLRLTNPTGGCIELYLNYGEPPTRGDAEYQSQIICAAEQEILVTAATPGTWYALVYSASAMGDYMVQADKLALSVSAVSPQSHGQADAELVVTGTGFLPGVQVALIAENGTAYTPKSVVLDTLTRLTLPFDLAGIPAGGYALRVQDGSNAAEVPFTVLAGVEEPSFETDLILPSQLGRHATATIYVQYTNTGSVSMPSPLVIVTATDKALLTLDVGRVKEGFWTSAQPVGFSDTIRFVANGEIPGTLAPGETRQIPIYYAGLLQPWDFSDNSVNFKTRYILPGNDAPLNWVEHLSDRVPAGVDPEAWAAVTARLQARFGPTWGSFQEVVVEDIAYFGTLGQRVSELGRVIGFELRRAIGFGRPAEPGTIVDHKLPGVGPRLVFSRRYRDDLLFRNREGAMGRGWTHNWEYALLVEPDGTVLVSEPLTTRRFEPDSRGGYLTHRGSVGTLEAVAPDTFQVSDPTGTVWTYIAGKLELVEDANGNSITLSHGPHGPTILAHTSGFSLDLEYGPSGLLTGTTDSVDNAVTYSHDALDRLTQVTEPNGVVTTYGYGATAGPLAEWSLTSIERGERVLTLGWDDSGAFQSLTANGVVVQEVEYGDAGLFHVTGGSGSTVTHRLDARGVTIARVQGASTHWTEVDAFTGQLTRAVDALGRVTRFERDAQGRLLGHTDPSGARTSFEYTKAGALSAHSDPRGHTTEYHYDVIGNRTAVTWPDGSSSTFVPGPLGLPTQTIGAGGNAIQIEYNAAGQVTSRVTASEIASYEYDEAGRLIAYTDATGKTVLDRDAMGQLVGVTRSDGLGLTMTWDDYGRRTSMADQTGFEVEFTYDPNDRMTAVQQVDGPLSASYNYDGAGRLTGISYGNGVTVTYTWGAFTIERVETTGPSGNVLASFVYNSDPTGRFETVETAYGTWTYDFDASGQVVSATLDSTSPDIAGADFTFEWDASGNPAGCLADENNQCQSLAGYDLVHDADGNLIEMTDDVGSVQFVYDELNQLVSSSASPYPLSRDALGHVVGGPLYGGPVKYLVDPRGMADIVGIFSDGTPVLRCAHGPLLAGCIDESGTVQYYGYDYLGNTAVVTGPTGAPVASFAYGPFGTVMSPPAPGVTPFTFVGGRGVIAQDDGLYLMRARHYSPELGRFLTRDPSYLSGGDSNLYRYVGNDPIHRVDPSGRELYCEAIVVAFEIDCVFVSAAVGVVSGVLPGVGVGLLCIPGSRIVNWVCEEINDDDDDDDDDDEDDNDDEDTGDDQEEPPDDDPGDDDEDEDSDNAGSVDPNQKIGPAGIGPAGWLTGDAPFAYRIDFENDAEATAPAQQVDIYDPLDPALDWTTLRVTSVGWADTIIAAPPNSPWFETSVPMEQDGVTFEVQIQVGVDMVTGLFEAHFWSIDPTFGVPPGVETGFLPPEDGTGRGMGFVEYIIEAKPGLESGTEIRNVATIIFDLGENIDTNQIDPHDKSAGTDPEKECLNTIDVDVPSSSVSAPSESAVPSFEVAWSAVDAHSGVGGVDVFARKDGGGWWLWQDDVAVGSASFDGEHGATYDFYAVAEDKVDNLEVKAPVVEASVAVAPPHDCVFVGCDDGDACTTGTCSATDGCALDPVVCDDGLLCTADACDAGAGCTATPLLCDDGDACTSETCVAWTRLSTVTTVTPARRTTVIRDRAAVRKRRCATTGMPARPTVAIPKPAARRRRSSATTGMRARPTTVIPPSAVRPARLRAMTGMPARPTPAIRVWAAAPW